MTEQDNKQGDRIKMVENALVVLDLLRTQKGSLGVNEIAKLCNLSPSTVHRILKTASDLGWAFQLTDERYIIGEKIGFVTEKDNLYLALKDVSKFIMNSYTARYGHAMNLMVRENTNCVILQQSNTDKLIDYIPPISSTLPFHACAGGKILLSECPISLVELILSSSNLFPLTPHTITDPDAFWQQLRSVSRQGYAIDHQESALNGTCIAVPVRDKNNNIIASLSFSGFVGIQDPCTLLEYVPVLLDASSEISKALYRCWGMH